MDNDRNTQICDRTGPVRRKHDTDSASAFHNLLLVLGEHDARVSKRVPAPALLAQATGQIISAANVIDLINTA